MKKKNALVRTRNTLAKRLRNCGTLEERWFLLHTGSPCPSELARLLYSVLEERNAERKWYFSGPNLTDAIREIFAKWRAGLEQRTGKLILPILMNGDAKAIRELADTVEKMENLNGDYPPESDPLRVALLKLFRYRVLPWRMSWNQLEKELDELRAGKHAREHILRVIKELQLQKLIQIIPAKRGPSRI
jgi:hypothetical protein